MINHYCETQLQTKTLLLQPQIITNYSKPFLIVPLCMSINKRVFNICLQYLWINEERNVVLTSSQGQRRFISDATLGLWEISLSLTHISVRAPPSGLVD